LPPLTARAAIALVMPPRPMKLMLLIGVYSLSLIWT
jgi:hypothetical protein